MLGLWLPMAASIVMMVLEPTIINVGLARSDHAEISLAAYGVAYGMAILIESPIIMLIDASTAKSTGRQAFMVVRRFTVWLGLAVTAVGLIVSFTPLYDLVIEQLMRIPHEIATETRMTLRVLSLWAFPIGWRRAHQGVLDPSTANWRDHRSHSRSSGCLDRRSLCRTPLLAFQGRSGGRDSDDCERRMRGDPDHVGHNKSSSGALTRGSATGDA